MIDGVDNDAGQEVKTTRSIEINAPRYLEEGKNFFEYPPFGNAIATVSSSSGIDDSDFRRMLHYASTNENTLTHLWLGTGPHAIPRLVDFVRRGKGTQYPKEETTRSVREIIKILGDYPDWDEYVRAKCDKSNYSTDGRFMPRESVFVPNSSYPEWLSERVKSEKRLKDAQIQVVLVDTFPQQLGGQTISDVVSQSGARPTNRKWRIIKGSGISGGPR